MDLQVSKGGSSAPAAPGAAARESERSGPTAPDRRRGGREPDEAELIDRAARMILREFDAYYVESRHIPQLAQEAFEKREWAWSFQLSKRRLSVYSESIAALHPRLQGRFPSITQDERLWRQMERRYLTLIKGRYEADLAFAYVHSVRREIYHGEWAPVAYDFGEAGASPGDPAGGIVRAFSGGAPVSPGTVAEILGIPALSKPFRDLRGDAALTAERINRSLALDRHNPGAVREIQMIDAGFFRNRGAYLLGRIALSDGSHVPLAVALLNGRRGIYVDAVLTSESDVHHIFNSTLANFHVTSPHYHELAAFLFAIMPARPLGLHYSTIGFNHVGKVAVMNEMRKEMTRAGETLRTAIGFSGTVAIAFSAPSSNYVLKVIRNEPTANYKWGTFEGVERVLRKYGRVHEINRTGSMLDNIIYYNLKLDRDWFDPAVLEEVLEAASDNVSLQGEDVIFKHLIAQRKMIPLPVFLETASAAAAEVAVVNLGHCIKNNAAANIFNRDLDGRNYGVSRFLKVYLYDYDAVERFTDVKIRTNLDRVDGEEEVPDWFFEDGVIFLPEEIEAGLRIPDRDLRRLFREVHGDLLTTGYWQDIQDMLRAGKVPQVRTYPDARKLSRG